MKKLRHMEIFAHIVETGSITRAAESLQLSKSVVSQNLKVLEQNLGVLLIKRSTRKHNLTSAGKAFYESCKAINTMTDLAWNQAQESLEVPTGLIKITAPHALMDVIIAPAIGQLLQKYPLLEAELINSDEHVDLMSEDIDLAIRVGQSKASDIKQRKIGEFRDVLCCSHSLYLQENNTDTAYIANTWQPSNINHKFYDAEGNITPFEAKVKCRANSFYSCLALIKEGAGIGLIPDFQFTRMQPPLYEVFPKLQLQQNQVYALHTYNKHLPASVKVCIEAIEDKLFILSPK